MNKFAWIAKNSDVKQLQSTKLAIAEDAPQLILGIIY